MVSPISLYVFASILSLLAIVVAWLGDTKTRDALADGYASLMAAAVVLVASATLFAFSGCQTLSTSTLWHNAGTAVLMASAPATTLALRYRGARTIPRALTGSTLALVGIVVWLTLNLRGPRGGWSVGEVVLVLLAAAFALASAACLGWWSKPVTARNTATSENH